MNTISDNFGNALRQQGPVAAFWLFLAFALILFLNLGLQIYRVTATQPVALPAPVERADQRGQAAIIGAAELFGSLDPAAAGEGALPETDLQLTLRGVFTSDSTTQSSAIIEEPDGSASYYRLGAEIVPGTRLEAVHRDRVVLARSGQYESLYFPTPDTLSAEAAQLARSLPADVDVGRLQRQQQQQQMTADSESESGETIDPARLKQLQQEEIDKRRAMVRQKLEELRARSHAQ